MTLAQDLAHLGIMSAAATRIQSAIAVWSDFTPEYTPDTGLVMSSITTYEARKAPLGGAVLFKQTFTCNLSGSAVDVIYLAAPATLSDDAGYGPLVGLAWIYDSSAWKMGTVTKEAGDPRLALRKADLAKFATSGSLTVRIIGLAEVA